MKKFEGILLCTDLDDTLLTTGDKQLSDVNRDAIDYFISQGGTFTFATGRVPMGATLLLDIIKPNAPMICFNGCGIYDFHKEELIWSIYLDKDALKVVEFVDKNYPDCGIEVCTDNNVYFCKENKLTQMHRMHENLPYNYLDYKNIFVPWKKVIFPIEEHRMNALRTGLENLEFAEKYDFVQSDKVYFEILPKGASKGAALMELAKILGIDPKRTIGIGDNFNDIEMVKMAGIGVAVANAVNELRQAADVITVDNDSNAIAAIINSLDVGYLKFE